VLELLVGLREHVEDPAGQDLLAGPLGPWGALALASVLFGLASFAEGVDLPGDYCRHVVIAKLPFAVPDDPIEAALSEWVEMRGGNAFMEITVPDAALKLVQACGRLLRTETDTGKVTLLDRRIVTKRYGKAVLDSLPAFTRVID
jgi:ATP-dependent DNA helicase DinG